MRIVAQMVEFFSSRGTYSMIVFSNKGGDNKARYLAVANSPGDIVKVSGNVFDFVRTDNGYTWKINDAATEGECDIAAIKRVFATRHLAEANANLILAVDANNSKVIDECIQAGANPNLETANDESLLVMAVMRDRVDACVALLRGGADVNTDPALLGLANDEIRAILIAEAARRSVDVKVPGRIRRRTL